MIGESGEGGSQKTWLADQRRIRIFAAYYVKRAHLRHLNAVGNNVAFV